MEQIHLEAVLRHTEDREEIWDSHYAFTKGKSLCLTSTETFHDGVTTSVDKGTALSVISVEFCKAFDTILKYILLSKSRDLWIFMDGLYSG